jgi:hypothetical protein
MRDGSAIARSNKIRSTDKSANFVSPWLNARARDVQSSKIAPLGYYPSPGILRAGTRASLRVALQLSRRIYWRRVYLALRSARDHLIRRREKESPRNPKSPTWKGSRPGRTGEKNVIYSYAGARVLSMDYRGGGKGGIHASPLRWGLTV